MKQRNRSAAGAKSFPVKADQPAQARRRSPREPALSVINPHAAGIDVHADMHMVCVPADRVSSPAAGDPGACQGTFAALGPIPAT